jgi:ATP-dependent RNA helicase RhlE
MRSAPSPTILTEERTYVKFADLGLIAPILSTLAKQGFDTPTPIQMKAIPPVLQGRDVIGLAQTGTGKTAAFALPILHRLSSPDLPRGFRPVRALILSPTRELAAQIEAATTSLGEGLGLRTAVVVGGVSIRRQINTLRNGVDILVATPGRLEDLLAQGVVKLDRVHTVVLDEADQMLDIGFMPAIRRILKLLPKVHQTLLFSATMPKEIRALSEDHLTDPVEVSVAPLSSTAERIDQTVIHVGDQSKVTMLADLVQQNGGKRIIVFARTKHGADKIVRKLNADKLGASAIHGNKSQGQRERALEGFRDGTQPVLIATDIAARGIDVPGVELVVNFDLPNVPEVYVHRIGRTGRNGASGTAVSYCSTDEVKLLTAIERLTRQSIPGFDPFGNPVKPRKPANDRGGPSSDGAKPNQNRARRSRRGRGKPNVRKAAA